MHVTFVLTNPSFDFTPDYAIVTSYLSSLSVLIISKVIPFRFIDAHRMKIQGEGVAQIFDWRVKAFWENCPGASPILAFIAFLLRSFWKI
jgi:hypothetical protein